MKTVTLKAERQMGAHDCFRVHYGIFRDLDVVEHRSAAFRIDRKGRQLAAEKGAYAPRSFWVEQVLGVGDSIHVQANPTHDLANDALVSHDWGIGATFQVSPDGSLRAIGD